MLDTLDETFVLVKFREIVEFSSSVLAVFETFQVIAPFMRRPLQSVSSIHSCDFDFYYCSPWQMSPTSRITGVTLNVN
jgi:hypothetical protein